VLHDFTPFRPAAGLSELGGFSSQERMVANSSICRFFAPRTGFGQSPRSFLKTDSKNALFQNIRPFHRANVAAIGGANTHIESEFSQLKKDDLRFIESNTAKSTNRIPIHRKNDCEAHLGPSKRRFDMDSFHKRARK
jgi:hypothetical protein